MTVVLDTSILAGFLNARDPAHTTAVELVDRIRRGEFGAAVSNDYVLDEGMTLLQTRTAREEDCRRLLAFFEGSGTVPLKPLLLLHRVSPEHLRHAGRLFFRHFDRKLSFTDCTLVALATDLEAPIASFDRHFDGIVPRIP